MEAGMKEDIQRKHGCNKTKEVFTFDEGLADKQATFLLTARPILAARTALDGTGEDPNRERTLKEEIPTDKHLFPDELHERIKSEHSHSTTNDSLVSKPAERPRFQPGKSTKFQKPFRGKHTYNSNQHGGSGSGSGATTRKAAALAKQEPKGGSQHQTQKTEAGQALPKLTPIHPRPSMTVGTLANYVQNWALITQDPCVFRSVKGYKIPFVR